MIANSLPDPDKVSAIRLYCPSQDPPSVQQNARPVSGSPPRLSPSMSLCELYAAYVLPVVLEPKNSAPGTLKQYRETLGYWARFTGDPPLEQIDDWVCAQFVSELQKLPGTKPGQTISPNTVRKHCVHLQFVLDRAGPKGRERRRRACGLLADVPYLERPKKREKPARDNFTLDEIERWLAACRFARDTENLQGVDPEGFWRALILFAYNTGLRIDSIMTATWEMVDRQEPNWIAIPAGIYKGRTHGLDLYLNRWARSAIESIRRKPYRPTQMLFPWSNWPTSQGWLQTCRRHLLEQAALPEHRRFGFHGLRKALTTWIAPINPMLARMVAGHRGGVTQECYVNPSVIEDILSRVPQPAEKQQRRIF